MLADPYAIYRNNEAINLYTARHCASFCRKTPSTKVCTGILYVTGYLAHQVEYHNLVQLFPSSLPGSHALFLLSIPLLGTGFFPATVLRTKGLSECLFIDLVVVAIGIGVTQLAYGEQQARVFSDPIYCDKDGWSTTR
jgi:hypothetical protein